MFFWRSCLCFWPLQSSQKIRLPIGSGGRSLIRNFPVTMNSSAFICSASKIFPRLVSKPWLMYTSHWTPIWFKVYTNGVTHSSWPPRTWMMEIRCTAGILFLEFTPRDGWFWLIKACNWTMLFGLSWFSLKLRNGLWWICSLFGLSIFYFANMLAFGASYLWWVGFQAFDNLIQRQDWHCRWKAVSASRGRIKAIIISIGLILFAACIQRRSGSFDVFILKRFGIIWLAIFLV